MTTHTPLTSQQWWQNIKADGAKLLDWLKNQYHGEVTAQSRILDFANQYAPEGSRWRPTLKRIAEQEGTHAGWVGELLTARGLTPEILVKDVTVRFWVVFSRKYQANGPVFLMSVESKRCRLNV